MGILASLFQLFTSEDQANPPSQRQELNLDNRGKTTEERLDKLLRTKK